MPFNFNARRAFITAPQTDQAPADCLAKLQDHLGDVYRWAVIAQERHDDGGLHLHVLVEFTKQFHFRGEDYFEPVFGKQVNIQTVRNLRASMDYLTNPAKEGHICFIADGVDPASVGKRKSTKAVIAALADSQKSVEEIYQQAPEAFVGNHRQILDFIQWRIAQRTVKQPDTPWTPFDISIMQEGGRFTQLATWLNWIPTRRRHRQYQLYLSGQIGRAHV